MRKVGVVGLGLIGGSIASALKANGFYVVGVESDPAALSYALLNGIIDSQASIGSFLSAFPSRPFAKPWRKRLPP